MKSTKIGENEEEEAQHTMPYLHNTLNHIPYDHKPGHLFLLMQNYSLNTYQPDQRSVDVLLHTKKRNATRILVNAVNTVWSLRVIANFVNYYTDSFIYGWLFKTFTALLNFI